MAQRSDYNKFLDVMREHNITVLYHFTDRSNLQSIINFGGLFSLERLRSCGIDVPRPGGSGLSLSIDSGIGTDSYVHLSFAKDHPMMHVALGDGRLKDPVVLEINANLLLDRKTKFSNVNAAKAGAHIGGSIEDFRNLDFTLFQQRYFDLDYDKKSRYQAEVLVWDCVKLRDIVNISSFGLYVDPKRLVRPAIFLFEPVVEEGYIADAIGFAQDFHFPVDITYRKYSGEVTKRRISDILPSEEFGEGYISAYCELRRENRTFRIDRILEARVLVSVNKSVTSDMNGRNMFLAVSDEEFRMIKEFESVKNLTGANKSGFNTIEKHENIVCNKKKVEKSNEVANKLPKEERNIDVDFRYSRPIPENRKEDEGNGCVSLFFAAIGFCLGMLIFVLAGAKYGYIPILGALIGFLISKFSD